jgi:HAE1 family hydrophobic/amphiphilic exporter-1
MSKYSVKRPFTVFVAVVIALILGAVSFSKMTTDLLPDFSLPYVVVVTTYPGASPEKIESTVTEPLESGLGTVNGVVNVTSTSSENYSMVMLEFEEDTNMDSAMVKLSSALDLISLPDGTGTPMIMEISMDMVASMYVSVDYDGMDIYELSDFVEETLVPTMERQDGVASVDTTGAVEKTVEIRLNQEKIDGLNDQLAAYVNDQLDDAKEELDNAKQEVADAKAQLETAQKELESTQQSTANELASASKLVDQAVATQAAYSAQLTSLQASKAALEAEKSAYEEAGISGDYDQILANIRQLVSESGQDASLYPEDLEDALNNPEKLEALSALLAQIQQGTAGFTVPEETTQQLNMVVKAYMRLIQIDTELANLDTEILAASAVLDTVNEQVQQATDNYEALEAGKITAAAGFGSGAAQIAAGQTAITSGEEQLEEAQKSYESGRDTALKSANLDSLLSISTLSGLIYAQNFAMPAGYIYEGEDQYLLKVGDEFSSMEELENALLCSVDGIGDVRLSDVADVTWIDNSGDAYAKVNGQDAVVLSISKSSTAGTSDVSDACNEAFEQLEAQYEGLHITSLMDQGEYIDVIVQSVLSNLIWGAILAIIVLAIFLRSVKPTIVVAFSIPISVLVAVVLMYFSGVTLNIISLSGLALGIGMLVDNSIVVIENIYRLRGLGVPSAKAAVMGAKQVAGAIAASTLTTICVFLPIIFVSGLVKELFVDLALTIAYSLVASLLIALTLVPAMSSTLLRNTEPKPQRFLNKVLDVYEKVLRFCLRRKVVPIAIAVALLLGCSYKAVNTGLILFPSMGGEQMSVSMNVNKDLGNEEVFEVADEAMEQMQEIPGVEYVGMMSGSSSGSTSILSGGGDVHSVTVYILLDEETGKDNSKVADALEEVCAGLDLDDYSVSVSNMDMSSYMSSGLEINIYGEDTDELLKTSEDVMAMVDEIEGFENVTNGQEDGDATVELTIDKDKAMVYGLTVAQIFSELSTNLTTEATATTLTIDGKQYDVEIVNENDAVDVDGLLDYEFEIDTTDEDGATTQEVHTLGEFASVTNGSGLASIQRENQKTYITVSAETAEGYNTTLLSRGLESKLDAYEAPEGCTIEIAGESSDVMDAMQDILLMIVLAVALIYLIMVAQFQSLLSPFIVIFTIPLAFTGGLLGLFIAGEEISLVCMMGFLMLAGIIVNNGIVFVDYANQLRLDGMEKREALVETGRTRMRPILMTTMTTVLAMCTMVFSTDAAADMSRGMAIVVIGGLIYATLMTLIIVPVLYDLFFRRELKQIDVGTDKELDEDL